MSTTKRPYNNEQLQVYLREVEEAVDQLSAWERDFIANLRERWTRKGLLTDREYVKLVEIHTQHIGGPYR